MTQCPLRERTGIQGVCMACLDCERIYRIAGTKKNESVYINYSFFKLTLFNLGFFMMYFKVFLEKWNVCIFDYNMFHRILCISGARFTRPSCADASYRPLCTVWI